MLIFKERSFVRVPIVTFIFNIIFYSFAIGAFFVLLGFYLQKYTSFMFKEDLLLQAVVFGIIIALSISLIIFLFEFRTIEVQQTVVRIRNKLGKTWELPIVDAHLEHELYYHPIAYVGKPTTPIYKLVLVTGNVRHMLTANLSFNGLYRTMKKVSTALDIPAMDIESGRNYLQEAKKSSRLELHLISVVAILVVIATTIFIMYN